MAQSERADSQRLRGDSASERQQRNIPLLEQVLVEQLFSSGSPLPTPKEHPGFDSTIDGIWIGGNKYKGAEGRFYKALREAYDQNQQRLQEDNVDGEVGGRLAIAHDMEVAVPTHFSSHRTYEWQLSAEELEELQNYGASKGKPMAVFGVFHAHPAKLRLAPLSVTDMALVLSKPSEDAPNPYMIHGMVNGKHMEAVVRTHETPILEFEAYKQELAKWNARFEGINERLRVLNEQVQTQLAADQAWGSYEEFYKATLARIQAVASEAGDTDIEVGMQYTLDVFGNIYKRYVRQLPSAASSEEIAVAINGALTEAVSQGVGLRMIYEMCKEYNLLYLTTDPSPTPFHEMRLLVDPLCRKAV